MKRRNFLHSAGITLGAVVLPSVASGNDSPEGQWNPARGEIIRHFHTIHELKTAPGVPAGSWVKTLGFHYPGDGGAALYQLSEPGADLVSNDADIISLNSGLMAVLRESESVSYRMFGALCDGKSDDGIQIKLAHQYANRRQVPVVNLSGEFWIVETNDIPIRTPVQWGKSIIHVDERHNRRGIPRFVVENDSPSINLSEDEELKNALIRSLKPGVQIIPGLAPWAGHLVIVLDEDDRIGIRAGYDNHRGWAREELFYVEEEGRVIGDIAWEFKDLTSITAIPCNDNYLVIQGGCFYFSGHSPQGSSPGYHHNGFSIQRSRTIIREQWMGLEPGRRDESLEPRNGLYTFNGVYDVTLENIRAIPWEKSRRPPEQEVLHGTYGISGARMLNCNFVNLTAEGGWVAWGVFGTNLNKNFRLERCRLNRVDIHFHCWNLYISNCTIGFKGITVTGGGDLFITDTTRHGNYFITFRPDYGAKWDGPIRLRGCTLKPSESSMVRVLRMHPGDIDYKYPIVLGTSISIEDMNIDYTALPSSTEQCWLMDISPMSVNSLGQRLIFPGQMIFRNIIVTGREQGVRLIRISNPQHYDLQQGGGTDRGRMQPNFTMLCENVRLEKIIPVYHGDPHQVHLLIGLDNESPYTDQRALHAKLVFVDCEDLSFYLNNCAASVFMDRCSVNSAAARKLTGELNFNNCSLQPDVQNAGGMFYALESSHGTRFTNCTIHAPIVNGKPEAGLLDSISFLEINKSLMHFHLNTTLGAGVLEDLNARGIKLEPGFISMLKSRHELE